MRVSCGKNCFQWCVVLPLSRVTSGNGRPKHPSRYRPLPSQRRADGTIMDGRHPRQWPGGSSAITKAVRFSSDSWDKLRAKSPSASATSTRLCLHTRRATGYGRKGFWAHRKVSKLMNSMWLPSPKVPHCRPIFPKNWALGGQNPIRAGMGPED